MAVYIVFLLLIAVIMLIFFYKNAKFFGSILLSIIFLSLTIKLIYKHKKPVIKNKDSLNKSVLMKKFYSIMLFISVFLAAFFHNPNYAYSSIIIGVLTVIFFIMTEFSTKQKTKMRYYLIIYLLAIALIKLLLERELILNRTVYLLLITISGIISLIGILYSLEHNFTQTKENLFKFNNSQPNKNEETLEPAQNFKKLTDVDHLYDFLFKEKNIKLSKISQNFNVTREKAEEWCKILEEGGLAIIHYPPIGEPEIRWKSIR